MNNEIEELLNELQRRKERYDYCKNNDISFSDEDYKSYLLLSYIEQLELLKEKYQLEKECYKIKVNKALEYCKESSLTIKSHYFSDVINILKGDSE